MKRVMIAILLRSVAFAQENAPEKKTGEQPAVTD